MEEQRVDDRADDGLQVVLFGGGVEEVGQPLCLPKISSVQVRRRGGIRCGCRPIVVVGGFGWQLVDDVPDVRHGRPDCYAGRATLNPMGGADTQRK
ncbi:hypothetical protein Q5530_16725 [Saccharothrix sp. BKS2]|uniref:hypothetical protein n=1 Tax=Saccharothrix sp. BKS2 TaxID=3064400 RepID=UPI0039ED9907